MNDPCCYNESGGVTVLVDAEGNPCFMPNANTNKPPTTATNNTESNNNNNNNNEKFVTQNSIVPRINPLEEEVPPQNEWPVADCPIIRNKANQKVAFQQFLDEGNRYRTDRSMERLEWSDALAMTAQMIASNASREDKIGNYTERSIIYSYTQGINRTEGTFVHVDRATDPMDLFEKMKDMYKSETEMDKFSIFANTIMSQYNYIGAGWKGQYFAVVAMNLSQPTGTKQLLVDGSRTQNPTEIDADLYCACTNDTYERYQTEGEDALFFVNQFRAENLEYDKNLSGAAMELTIEAITQDGIIIGNANQLAQDNFFQADTSVEVVAVNISNPMELQFLDLVFTLAAIPDNTMWNQITGITYDRIGFFRSGDHAIIVLGKIGQESTREPKAVTSPHLLCGTDVPAGISENNETTVPMPCPEYTWDVTDRCPQSRTYEAMKMASEPVIAEGNRYRTAKGLPPLIWNANLTAAAQWHASFLYDNYATAVPLARQNEQGEAIGAPGQAHGETVTERSENANFAGNVYQMVYIGEEGANNTNPMQGFCAMKDTFVSDSDTGRFGMFTDSTKPEIDNRVGFIGIGWKKNIVVYVAGGCPFNFDNSHLYDMPEIGDVKITLNSTDHDGWYVLDGRDINLLPSEDAINAAMELRWGIGNEIDGIFGALPNTQDAYIGSALDDDETLPKGVLGGDYLITMAEENLPVVTIPVSSTVSSSLSLAYLYRTHPHGGFSVRIVGGSRDGEFSANQLVMNLNPNAQVPIEIKPKKFAVRMLVYLGL